MCALRLFPVALAVVCCLGGPAQSAGILDPYLFLENRSVNGGAPQSRVQIGALVEPGTANGVVTGQWQAAPAETPFAGQPFDLSPFPETDGSGAIFLGFSSTFSGFDFVAERDLEILFTDDLGTTSAVVTAAVSDSTAQVPLVTNIMVGSGPSPIVSWENPGDAAALAALGIDFIRVRVVDDRPDLFDNSRNAVTDDLSETSVRLPDISLLVNPVLRVELIDARDGSFPAPGTFPDFVRVTELPFQQSRRSSAQVTLDPASAVVPLPAGLPMLMAGLAGLAIVSRRRRS